MWRQPHREKAPPCPLTAAAPAVPSYASGTSDVPLLGDTIGDNFDRDGRRPARRRGAGGRAERAALDLRPAARGRRHGGARAARRGPREGRPGRDLGAQRRRVDARAVRHREDRRHPRQHQPGVPHARAGVRAQPGRDRAAGRGHELQDVRLRGDDRGGAAELPRAAPGGAASGTPGLGRARRGGQARRPRRAGAAAGRAVARTTRSTSSTRRAPRASPRAPRSRTTTSSTTATSSDGCAATAPTTGCASRCPSTTASAW